MARRSTTLHPGFIYLKRHYQHLSYKASKIRVLVAHGHMLYGEALKHLLQIGNMIDVVGVAGDCRETMDKYLTFRPQVLVVDALLPPQGVNGLRPLLNEDPPPKILLLTGSINGAEAGMSPEAQVFGFQPDCNGADLRRTVRSLAQGTGQPLHSKVAAKYASS